MTQQSALCATRALKNLRFLEQNAPDVFIGPEPALGWGSVLPTSVLAALNTAPPATFDGPLDLTQLAQVTFPAVQPKVTEPVFSGAVYFVRVNFTGTASPGAVSVPSADISTAVRYATIAAPVLARYTSQYGQTAITISPTVLSYDATTAGGTYTDSDLQNWVNAIMASAPLPASACVAVLNPAGVTNSDAALSQGVLGYHGMAEIPYVFVNMLGTGFTLDDHASYYAAALSHELAEVAVDPRADDVNPGVCDPCADNCNNQYYSFFGASGNYLGSGQAVPPAFSYGFFTSAVVKPAAALDCPAPTSACAYADPA